MFVFGFLPLGLERIGIFTNDGTDDIFRLRDDGGGTLDDPDPPGEVGKPWSP